MTPKGPNAMSTSPLWSIPTIPFQDPSSFFDPHLPSGGLTWSGRELIFVVTQQNSLNLAKKLECQTNVCSRGYYYFKSEVHSFLEMPQNLLGRKCLLDLKLFYTTECPFQIPSPPTSLQSRQFPLLLLEWRTRVSSCLRPRPGGAGPLPPWGWRESPSNAVLFYHFATHFADSNDIAGNFVKSVCCGIKRDGLRADSTYENSVK